MDEEKKKKKRDQSSRRLSITHVVEDRISHMNVFDLDRCETVYAPPGQFKLQCQLYFQE